MQLTYILLTTLKNKTKRGDSDFNNAFYLIQYIQNIISTCGLIIFQCPQPIHSYSLCLEDSDPSTQQTCSYGINLNAVSFMNPTLSYFGKFLILVASERFFFFFCHIKQKAYFTLGPRCKPMCVCLPIFLPIAVLKSLCLFLNLYLRGTEVQTCFISFCTHKSIIAFTRLHLFIIIFFAYISFLFSIPFHK